MTNPLRPYQRRCVAFALRHPGAGLFLDMGLGKTLTTIAVMDAARRRGENLKWLVLAPARVARDTWPDELKQWSGVHGLTWMSLETTPAKRRRLLDGPIPDVTIVSRDKITGLDKDVRRWPWDALVIDELSGFRNPRAARFRALKRHRRDMRRVIGLTGTPVPKSLENLWAQIYLLDQGEALGSSVTAYRRRWFHPGAHRGDVVYEWLPNYGAYEEIMDRLEPFCMTMLKADELPGLPVRPPTIRVPVAMPPATRRLYDQARRENVAELEDGTTITIANAGVLTGKLSQLAAGLLYPDGEAIRPAIPAILAAGPAQRPQDPPASDGGLPAGRITGLEVTRPPAGPILLSAPDPHPQGMEVSARLEDGSLTVLDPSLWRARPLGDEPGESMLAVIPSAPVRAASVARLDQAKLDAMADIVERLDGEPLLVFYRFKAELDGMRERFGHALHTLDEPDAVRHWNQGEYPILTCHPAAAQYGLNLQHGGHTILWTTPTWNLEEWMQSNARLDRSGQTRPVTVMVLCSDCGVDARMLDVLEGRAELADAVMDTLKGGR